MLLKYFYDEKLAHASYLVGCQRTSEAIVIDPARDITPYLETAKKEGMKLVGTADTHIHADYVSGARELAARTGARLYLSDEGGEDWKYTYANQYPHQPLKEGDRFQIGNIQFDVWHTPGHTPEHICYLVTDTGGGANRPMGMFTGDFVFVGSVGRPDLLEKAAGVANTAVLGAQQLFHSLQRFKTLPDYLQIWPAHGAGSACGKGLGAIPSSTVGYEKLFNQAFGYENMSEFVEMLLEGQPEPPKYFAVMKRVNKEGPAVLGERPLPEKRLPVALPGLLNDGYMVIDTRPSKKFAAAHVPGTLNISLNNLATWAGWLADYNKPLYLLTSAVQLVEAVKILAEIGLDEVAGYFDVEEVIAADLMTESYREIRPKEAADKVLSSEYALLDIRAQTEWEEGHLPHAQHIMLGYLPERLEEITNGRPLVVQCRSGNRSAIAASLLQAKGIKNVINLTGGITAWTAAGLPIVKIDDKVKG